MRWYKGLLFIILCLVIVQSIYAKKIPSTTTVTKTPTTTTTTTPTTQSWDEIRIGKEGHLPKPTAEEVYSDYVKSKYPQLTAEETTEMIRQLSESNPTDTSDYLIGTVSVGIIFVQGPGESFDSIPFDRVCYPIPTDYKTEIVCDIRKGLNWLRDQEVRSEINTWYRHVEPVVDISVKPSDCPIAEEDHKQCWIFPTMVELGYEGTDNGIYRYLNDLRDADGTDWAFAIFVAIGNEDGNFNDGYYAWSLGQVFIMTESLANNPDSLHRRNVTAHETMHIFGAQDEYAEGCVCVNTYVNYGYDDITVPNHMCEKACPDSLKKDDCIDCIWHDCDGPEDCAEGEYCSLINNQCKHECIMMGLDIPRIGNFSRAQMGWRDCDRDGTLDALEQVEDICGYPTDTDWSGTDSRKPLTKGTCSGGCNYTTWECDGAGYTDYCIDDYTLAEYFLVKFVDRPDLSDTCSYKRIDCTEIDPSYVCYDGECVAPLPSLNFTPNPGYTTRRTKARISNLGSFMGQYVYVRQDSCSGDIACQSYINYHIEYCEFTNGVTPGTFLYYACVGERQSDRLDLVVYPCTEEGGYCTSHNECCGYTYCSSVTGKCTGSSGGGGCPTLFVYDGKDYVKERKSRIHSEGDVVDKIILNTKPVAEDGIYSLSLKETTLPEHSYIDTVKLFVDGKEAELISAVHSKYGDVTSILKESDDIRTDTKVFDEIELKFLAPEIEGEFLFEIEGYNRMWAGAPYHMVKLDIYQLIPIVIIAVLAIIVVVFAVLKFFAKK